MTSKERVIKTLTFDKPDRLPLDLWLLPGTITKYGDAVTNLLQEIDFTGVEIHDPTFDPRIYEKGSFTDAWGCGWHNMQSGIIGEVKHPPLADDHAVATYKTPKEVWSKACFNEVDADLKRKQDKFTITGYMNVFERMQFLRGTENLYMDIAEENEMFFQIRDMVVDYYMHYLDFALEYDVDAIALFDDWGSQRSLLISPNSWRNLFKPIYKALIDKIKAKGKYVFFHSDGYIMDIYSEFIELGVNAVNSQLWCMGVEEVAQKFAGKITFWGEISRQDTIPHGTKEDVENSIAIMKKNLIVNGGGLIGQFEAGPDAPMDTIVTALRGWNK